MRFLDSHKEIDLWESASYFCTFAALTVFLVGLVFAWSMDFFLNVIVATLIVGGIGIVADIRVRLLKKKDATVIGDPLSEGRIGRIRKA